MRAIPWFLVLFGLASLPSCSGTAVGNPPSAEVKLAVVGTSSSLEQGEPVKALDVGGGIQIEEAWVALRDIGLRSAKSCDAELQDSDVLGPVAVDLVAGITYPEIPAWEQPPDERYCAVKVKLRPLEEAIGSAPEELLDHTVYIRGTRGDGTPFIVQGDLAVNLKTGAKSGPEFMLGQGLIGLILAFDLSAWLDQEQMNAAEVTDGVILIGGDHNKEMGKALLGRIPASTLLFRDEDRDGKLDEDDGEI